MRLCYNIYDILGLVRAGKKENLSSGILTTFHTPYGIKSSFILKAIFYGHLCINNFKAIFYGYLRNSSFNVIFVKYNFEAYSNEF